MRNLIIIYLTLGLFWTCEPKKDPAPAAILGLSFIEIETPNSNMMVGDTLRLSSKFTNEKNEISTPTFTWISSKADVAVVSQTGTVKALKIGQSLVICEFGGKKDTVIVTVLPTQMQTSAGQNTVIGTNSVVDLVLIIARSGTMQINGTQQMQAVAYNSNSELLADKPIVWTSSNNSTLEISAGGLVTAKKTGSASIIASSEGVSSIAYGITVSNIMRSGTFVGVGGYTSRGTATLKYNSGGNLIVEFGTDFSVQSGPDLYVFLSNASSGSGINNSGLQLAQLGANSGSRSYTTPAGTDIATYKYVVVQCKQFASTFGYAELR